LLLNQSATNDDRGNQRARKEKQPKPFADAARTSLQGTHCCPGFGQDS